MVVDVVQEKCFFLSAVQASPALYLLPVLLYTVCDEVTKSGGLLSHSREGRGRRGWEGAERRRRRRRARGGGGLQSGGGDSGWATCQLLWSDERS
jgi:hypothetical protein